MTPARAQLFGQVSLSLCGREGGVVIVHYGTVCSAVEVAGAVEESGTPGTVQDAKLWPAGVRSSTRASKLETQFRFKNENPRVRAWDQQCMTTTKLRFIIMKHKTKQPSAKQTFQLPSRVQKKTGRRGCCTWRKEAPDNNTKSGHKRVHKLLLQQRIGALLNSTLGEHSVFG